MRNLLVTKKQEKKVAEIIAAPIAIILVIIFYLIKLFTRLLIKLKKQIFKLTVVIFVVYGLCSFFIDVANAPKAQAALTSDYVERVVVTLPMKVNPDMKLRETVLSLVRIEFGEDQVDAFDELVLHESGWDPKALNKSSGACGLFQSLPCSKMKSMDIEDQISFGFNYIKARYGTPNKAWAFWQAQSPHWY